MNHNQIQTINSEDSNKNDEDLLGYKSKYKPDLYKEDDLKGNEEDNKLLNKCRSDNSTSISASQENSVNNNFRRKQTLSKGESTSYNLEILYPPEKERKMSSPLFSYYNDSNEYLSKTHKTPVDYKNKTSQNFVKKEDFFNNSINTIFINNSFYQNYNVNNQNLIIPGNKINKNISCNNNFYFQNNINNNNQQEIYNINNYINNESYNNLNKRKLSYNIDGNIISNYFNNILGQNNNNPNELLLNFPQPNLNPFIFSYNESQEKEYKKNIIDKKSNNKSNKKIKKPFDKRKGDWTCPKCNNLNFAFRIVCNICQIPKP